MRVKSWQKDFKAKRSRNKKKYHEITGRKETQMRLQHQQSDA